MWEGGGEAIHSMWGEVTPVCVWGKSARIEMSSIFEQNLILKAQCSKAYKVFFLKQSNFFFKFRKGK